MNATQDKFLNAIRPEDGFWLLFEHLRDVYFFLKDRKSRLVLVNHQLVEHYRMRSAADLLGKNDREYLPRSLAEKYIADDQTVVRTAKPLLNMIELFMGDDGIPDWYLTSKYPVFDRAARVLGVMGVIQRYSSSENRSLEDQRLARAVEFVREHFTERISERQLMEHMRMPARQLQRMFQAKLRSSFRQVLIRMRVHKACDQLRLSDRSHAQIARECGFYDQASFSRQFKALMGVTPRAYRKRW